MDTKRITDVAGLNFLWKVDNLYLAGQPSLEALDTVKDWGIKTIINLRDNAEMDFAAEEAKSKELGMDYVQFPIMENGALSATNCERLSEMVNTEGEHFIHCGSANRVGGWLITYLVKYRGIDFEAAVEVAMNNGLTAPALIEQAQEVLEG